MDENDLITSRDNRRLVGLRKVRDGKDRSLIFIEGVRLCEEAVRSGLAVEDCFASETFDAWDRFRGLEARAVIVSEKLFPSISDTDNSQGIVLTAARPQHELSDVSAGLERNQGVPLTIFLSEVNNPANLGAVMRTAEAAGAAGIITSPGSTDAYSPKSLRAAMGSAFRLPVVENVDLDEALAWAGNLQLSTVAVDVGGELPYLDINWKRPSIVVFGSEAHGLNAQQLEAVDQRVVIPMDKSVESLNLAVSAGVMLFEARRQNLG